MTSLTPAVVVGGGSGIGAAVAEQLRMTGAAVMVWDVAGCGDLECDITDPHQVADATRTTIDEIGPPASVTITSGVGHSRYLADPAPEEWDRVMSVNARGSTACRG